VRPEFCFIHLKIRLQLKRLAAPTKHHKISSSVNTGYTHQV